MAFGPAQAVYTGLGDINLISVTSASPLTTGTLFTFTGSIEIVRISGRVSTVIQSQATTVKLSVQPDAQTAVDICATKDVNAFAAGSLLEITGTAAGAMVGTTAVAVRAPATQIAVITTTCVTSGIITVTYGAASTGAIVWEMAWRRLSAGATVT